MKINRFLFAVIIVTAATAMRIWPLHSLETRLVWLTFYPAVMIVAVYGGFYAGLLATGLTCFAVTFMWPLLSVMPFIKDSKDLLGMAVFAFTGTMVSGIAEAMHRANRREKKSEEQYRALFDQSPLPKWVFSRESLRFLEVNDAAIKDYGYSREEFLEMTLKDIRQKEDIPVITNLLPREDWKEKARHRKKDGTVIDVEIWSRPFEWYGQKAILVVVQDITAQKEAENKMKEAKELAENTAKSMSEFLANMSHEIRTPLNAIIGMADLLGETRLDDEQKRYLNVFRGASESLLYLINDILDLAKIEAGQLDLEEIEFDLKETLDMAVSIVSPRARQKGLSLSLRIERPPGNFLVGDPVRLRQVLLNIMSNAVKFSSEGNIAVNAACAPAGEDVVKVEIAVSDQGIGIPKDKQPLLFERFKQGDASVTRRFGGSGLGLAISKMLVEKMRGDIRFESEPGKGSTFTFLVQFKKGTAIGKVPAENDLSGMSILVYFEDEGERNRIADLLADAGALIRRAASESELKRELAAAASGAPFTVILSGCDVMRGNTCKMAADLGRNLSTIGGATLLTVASSGICMNKPESGAPKTNCRLVAPVGAKELFRELREIWAERNKAKMTARNERGEGAFRILLVDDSKDNQLLAKAYLKKYPYHLEIAENGQEAVEKFIAGAYGLVFMDVQMPVKDGYTATKEIRAYEKRNNKLPTPIIALTANAYQEDVNKSIEAGCDAHMTKPIKKEKLLSAIESAIKRA